LPFPRPCKDCGEKYLPNSKWCKYCEKCVRKRLMTGRSKLIKQDPNRVHGKDMKIIERMKKQRDIKRDTL